MFAAWVTFMKKLGWSKSLTLIFSVAEPFRSSWECQQKGDSITQATEGRQMDNGLNELIIIVMPVKRHFNKCLLD